MFDDFGSKRTGRGAASVLLAAVLALGAMLLVLAGCSAVFEAGISGVLTDKDTGDGIPNVWVYAYTDEGLRDADHARGPSREADGFGLTFNPSTGGNYIPITQTDGQGRFTIGKLLWKTNKSEFGKTADYQDIYLLYFHSDYGLVKEPTRVTVVSDSNNSSRVQTAMTSRLKSKELRIAIKDVADMEDADVGFSVQVKSFLLDKDGVRYKKDGKDKEYYKQTQTVTGSGTFVVPYLADEAEGKTEVEVKIIPDSESTWSWVAGEIDEDGTANKDHLKLKGGDIPLKVPNADKRIRDEEAVRVDQTLYVKNYKFAIAPIQGRVETNGEGEGNDDIRVWLAEAAPDKKLKILDSVLTVSQVQGANDTIKRHGIFTGLGDGLEWEAELGKDGAPDDDYKGAVAKKDFYLIVDNPSGKPSEPDGTDFFYKFKIRSDDRPGRNNLGVVSTANKTAFPFSKYSSEVTGFED